MGMVPVMSSTGALPLERKPTTILSFRLYMQIYSLTNRISFSHFEKKITHSNPYSQNESTPTQLFRWSNAQDPGSLLFLPRRHCWSPGTSLSSASQQNFCKQCSPYYQFCTDILLGGKTLRPELCSVFNFTWALICSFPKS